MLFLYLKLLLKFLYLKLLLKKLLFGTYLKLLLCYSYTLNGYFIILDLIEFSDRFFLFFLLFQIFASMNSSFSSEVYSIDIGVETDSEMEWITPEMLLCENNTPELNTQPSTSSLQLATHANQNYSNSQSHVSSDSQVQFVTHLLFFA